MMTWRSGVSRRAIALGFGLLAAPMPAFAQTFTVPAGTTDAVPKTLSGTQTGTVEAGGTLRSTSGTATITTSTSSGVVVRNGGIIENTSSGRAVDTVVNNVVVLTFLNNIGAITRATLEDAIKIRALGNGSTVVIDNAGLIQAGGTGFTPRGQALDLRDVGTAGTSTTVTNRATGIIEAFTEDAIRIGQNGVVNNFGIIRSFGANTTGGASPADGININDGITGVVINNRAGGLISGARHGVDVGTNGDVTVNNDAGATIIGRNGSGVGSDGTGTVVNYGRITGAYAGAGNIFLTTGVASTNGDGDGVDIDFAATITNYGIIEGIGAGGFDSRGRANSSEGISIGGGTITNFGLISGANTGIVVNNDANPNRSGIAATTITNNAGGLIIGQNGYAIRLENKLGDARDNDTIVNRGTIIGNGAIPDPNAIVLMQNGLADPNSSGTLNGVLYTGTGSARFIRGDGSAIQTGEGADTLTNFGVIIGNNGRAVNLEGGADTMNVMPGSRITGLVDGGVGTDTLNYNKVGLTEAKRAQLQAGQTVNIGGTLYTSFEVVTGAAMPYASFGRTSSAVAVGNIFDNLPNTAPSSTAAVNLLDSLASASDIGAALTQLTPAAFQGLSRITLGATAQTAALVDQRLIQSRFGFGGNDLSGASQAFALLAGGAFDKHAPSLSRSLSENGDPFASMAYAPVTKAPPLAERATIASDVSLFLNSGLVFAREGARTDAPATRYQTANVVGGVDWRFTERAVVGAFGGYSASNGYLDTNGSSGRVHTSSAGLYAAYNARTWYASLLGLYGWSDYNTSRVTLGSINLGSFAGSHYTFRGTIGTDLVAGRFVVTPEASLQYTRVRTDGFNEFGGAAALAVASDASESLRSSVGARLSTDYRMAWGVISPELRAAWLHEFRDGARGITANFVDASLPGSFITTTGSGLRDRGLIGAGVVSRVGGVTDVSLNYDAIVGSNDSLAHQVTGRIRRVF